MNGYIASYRGKRIEVYAPSSYAAQTQAAAQFKARKAYDVSVYLCERADGSIVTQSTVI